MTFVGKILVIVIMAFALLFLGISTVVFSTATNWKAETDKQKQQVSKLQTSNNDLTEKVKKAEGDLQKAQVEHEAAKKDLLTRVAGLEDEIKRMNTEVTAIRGDLGVAQQSAKTALTEAEDRRKETEQLRDQKSAVEKQANEFKIRQTELIDKIRELTRQLETATKNNSNLREQLAVLQSALWKAGLSASASEISRRGTPPPVQGEVARVNTQNNRVELTIGSDDGLVPGHELFLFRTKPQPQYLGKIRIISVGPDQSVGQVIGTPTHGIKIQEGDHVASSLRPQL